MSNQNTGITLFISTQCLHCAQMLENMTNAIKKGLASQLKIINLSTVTDPELYTDIRSVPMLKIENFDFRGKLTQSELTEMLTALNENRFPSYYFSNQLTDGNINKVETIIKKHPEYWITLVSLAQDIETKLQVRIGITSIFETLSTQLVKSQQCNDVINLLIKASDTKEHAIRVDLIYILSLIFHANKSMAHKDTEKTNNILTDYIHTLQNDSSDEIKEIIEDVIS